MKRLLFAVAAVMAAFALAPAQAATFNWIATNAQFLASGGGGLSLCAQCGSGTIQADYLGYYSGSDHYRATDITGTFVGQPITGLAHKFDPAPGGFLTIDDMLVPMTTDQGITFYVYDGTANGFAYQIYNNSSGENDPRVAHLNDGPRFQLLAGDAVTGDGGGQGFVDFGVQLVTPIPGALPLFATGLGGLGLLSWRRKRKAAALAA